MKVRIPHFYDAFSCTGSACPDTCCIGWLIEIDDDSYERFMRMEGEFGERIRENIITREDGRFFALNHDGRCAFLNRDNLCEMVIRLGDGALCSLCDNYPRVGVDFGGLRELCLSLSCPEVSRLVLSSDEPICFGEWYQEETADVDYTKDHTFQALLEARDVLFGMLQNRDISIRNRAVLYLMYASRIQYAMDNDRTDEIPDIAEMFSDEKYINQCLASVKEADTSTAISFLDAFFDFIGGLENINEKWILLLSRTADRIRNNPAENTEKAGREFSLYYKEEYVYEHLMVYYVYRYFMKMVFDGDVYGKAVMCIAALVCIRQMDITCWLENGKQFDMEKQIEINYLYSKEIEHCEENLERLSDEFWDKEWYQPKPLIENLTKIL